MTSPGYPNMACLDGSQDRGDASPSDYAWIVNFHNGNANDDNRDNHNRVRAVRGPAREFQGEQVSLRSLHSAWKRARRKKAPSANQLAFDAFWADNLLDLQESLAAGTWRPRPTTCFVATRPKAREIHAPDFGDRVVHHWLVPQLDAIYESTFIHDSFANRRGKGSHAAVRRLQSFVRQVHSGQGGGWFLQMDVANFFNSIHRPTLYAILKRRMERAGLPWVARKAAHALLARSPIDVGVNYRSTAAERAQVPAHKRLANAPDGCGIPIGNLSSQFLANVYLDALDQFVKHELRAPRYLRYVDDFVLVHRDREQLERWRVQIERFLSDRLRLGVKDGTRLQPLSAGIDFLGYVMRPTHATVRRRVVSHAREALADWERRHVSRRGMRGTPADFERIHATWASYQGHFAHASSHRLQASLHRRFPWLASAGRPRRFHHDLDGHQIRITRK